MIDGLAAFLPENAILMGRTSNSTTTSIDSSALGGQGSPDAPLHLFLRPQSPAGWVLFDKMLMAIGLSRSEICVYEILGELPVEWPSDLSTKVVMILGFEEVSVSGAISSFSPDDLLENPRLKKQAWLDLQGVARALGLEIPVKKK